MHSPATGLLRFVFLLLRGRWHLDRFLHQVLDPEYCLVGGNVWLLQPFEDEVRVDESPGGQRACLWGRGGRNIGQ